MGAAQAEVRSIYRNGSVGQIYAGTVWLVSSIVWIAADEVLGIWILLVGGAFIYPVTTAVCRLLGTPGVIPASSPLRLAGLTIPIVGALAIPLVGAATLYEVDWFYPAFMIAMGAHYLPFAHLYGMRSFISLGAGMWVVGLVLALWFREWGVVGGWATGVALIAFGTAALRTAPPAEA